MMGRRRDEPDPHPEAGTSAGTSAGELCTDELATRVDVRRAVSRLNTEDRVLIHLRYGQDLKQDSIADLLDTPEGTVKVRLYRARERLRADLTDEPEGNHQPQ